VLTFHIGLALRMAYLNERRVPVTPQPASLLPGSWRRWQEAFERYESGNEAETSQAVGVRLRECLVSLIGEANWLTHAKNAGRLDAEMALKPVEHLLGFFTASSRLRECTSAPTTASVSLETSRTTILSRVTSLRSDEPWAGYDELTGAEVVAVVSEGDDDRAEQVRSYERAHKNRAGVLNGAERELAST
jgi:hypothetical protein